jgi:ubiquinone biosynthesis protein COQ9
MTEPVSDTENLRDRLLEAALPHVAFDGWSEVTFRAAAAEAGIAPGLARAVAPRGALDLALAFHARGDAAMRAALARQPLSSLRFRERVALAIRLRLLAVENNKEAVRRGATLLALPQNAVEGAAALWATADAIWTALGDSSDDLNWYTKRATLSAVYGASVLYWLGDTSPGHQATWEFVDRRIGDVMRFEEVKARVNRSPLGRMMERGPGRLAARIRAPGTPSDLPGRWG